MSTQIMVKPDVFPCCVNATASCILSAVVMLDLIVLTIKPDLF